MSEFQSISRESTLKFVEFGILNFHEARGLQETLIERRHRNDCPDTVLLGEHPPTLSIGRRVHKDELQLTLDEWKRLGIQPVEADRGGSATYHGPGQIIIYPVVAIRAKKLGVRVFVRVGLEAIAQVCVSFNLPAASDLCDAGVWISGSGTERRKIASVGLHIVHGVTNHGFAFNVSCSLEAFQLFRPCGLSGAAMTSLSEELSGARPVSTVVLNRLKFYLERAWT